MSASLEKRIAELERKVAQLEVAQANGSPAKDWKSTFGMFSGDEGMKEIDDLALAYREADRERARRRFARADKKKADKNKTQRVKQ